MSTKKVTSVLYTNKNTTDKREKRQEMIQMHILPIIIP